MEFASYLAGERWSDHPSCTHPALARLARLVNDWTSDAERGRLAVMVPSVVGLVAPQTESGGPETGMSGTEKHTDKRTDKRTARRAAAKRDPDRRRSEQLDITLAMLAAAAALPIASEFRQRALAVTVIRCLDRLEAYGPTGGDLRRRMDAALETAPGAARWARHQISGLPFRPALGSPIATEAMMVLAVTGIAEACSADVDGVLRDLLVASIEAARDILLPAPDREPALQSV
jgi:hypothetical protein